MHGIITIKAIPQDVKPSDQTDIAGKAVFNVKDIIPVVTMPIGSANAVFFFIFS